MESPIVLSTQAGDPVLLGQGNTWLELVHNDSSDVDPAVVTIN